MKFSAIVEQVVETYAAVIRCHEGYVAQPLGDRALVYFGYPTAHADDARRAIRTGLEIIEVVRAIPLPQEAKALIEELSH